MTDVLQQLRDCSRDLAERLEQSDRERDTAVREAYALGLSQGEIARAVGLSRRRVGQIVAGVEQRDADDASRERVLIALRDIGSHRASLAEARLHLRHDLTYVVRTLYARGMDMQTIRKILDLSEPMAYRLLKGKNR